jgi:hypothetical protein
MEDDDRREGEKRRRDDGRLLRGEDEPYVKEERDSLSVSSATIGIDGEALDVRIPKCLCCLTVESSALVRRAPPPLSPRYL